MLVVTPGIFGILGIPGILGNFGTAGIFKTVDTVGKLNPGTFGKDGNAGILTPGKLTKVEILGNSGGFGNSGIEGLFIDKAGIGSTIAGIFGSVGFLMFIPENFGKTNIDGKVGKLGSLGIDGILGGGTKDTIGVLKTYLNTCFLLNVLVPITVVIKDDTL